MPEVSKLIGGALIAAGAGGAVATVAAEPSSTLLVVAVWLLALLAGVVVILLGGWKRKRGSSGSETTVLTAIEMPGRAGEESGRSESLDGGDTGRPGPPRQDEQAWGEALENRPTTDFMPVPRSHRHLLDEQGGGDFLIWTPDRPEDEAGPGNEARILKLPLREWQHIGRSPRSDIQFPLDYRSISREHAMVKLREPGILLVRDLGSVNGTWVNGENVATYCRVNKVKAMPVRSDADIVVGRTAVTYGWRPAVKTRASGTPSGARSPAR